MPGVSALCDRLFREQMARPRIVTTVALLSAVLYPCRAQTPPAQVQTELCSISNVFLHLEEIKSSDACLDGCAASSCESDWYPGADDVCNAECGQIFEPFWDQCGDMLTSAGMGGMGEMNIFCAKFAPVASALAKVSQPAQMKNAWKTCTRPVSAALSAMGTRLTASLRKFKRHVSCRSRSRQRCP